MNEILTTAITAGLICSGLGYVAAQFFKGKKDASEQAVSSAQTLLDFWKDQAEGYKAMMEAKDKASNEKFESLMREIGELNGKLKAAEDQNKRFEEIFQNRNPELDNTLKEILTFMKKINEHMATANKGFKVESTITPDGKK